MNKDSQAIAYILSTFLHQVEDFLFETLQAICSLSKVTGKREKGTSKVCYH